MHPLRLPCSRSAQGPAKNCMNGGGLAADEVCAHADGIKAKLFKILGESEPLTSTEIWAKAEVRLLLDDLAS